MRSTAELLQALKNTAARLSRLDKNLNLESQADGAWARGIECEEWAWLHFARLGYTLLGRRVKVLGVELDLVMRSPKGHRVVAEVKSAPSDGFFEARLGYRQKLRLQRAAEAMAQGQEVEFCLVLVGQTRSSVQVIHDL